MAMNKRQETADFCPVEQGINYKTCAASAVFAPAEKYTRLVGRKLFV
jgi:hypothetical protein